MQLPFQSTQYPKPVIALGANKAVAGRTLVQTLHEAASFIGKYAGPIHAKSQVFRTPSIPIGKGPDYANAVLSLDAELDPKELLTMLHDIEKRFGRIRDERWGPRTLDLDVICYGDRVLPDLATFDSWRSLSFERQREVWPDQLILPHPRMHERAFVLIPMLEVAPDWRHPVIAKTVREMAADLPEADSRAIEPF